MAVDTEPGETSSPRWFSRGVAGIGASSFLADLGRRIQRVSAPPRRVEKILGELRRLRMRPHLTVEQRQLALRLKAQGLSLREIGPQVGCSHQGVALIVRHASRRPVRHDGWVPRPGRLTLADREEITLGLHAGQSFTAIAARLGKAVSTVSASLNASAYSGTSPSVKP